MSIAPSKRKLAGSSKEASLGPDIASEARVINTAFGDYVCSGCGDDLSFFCFCDTPPCCRHCAPLRLRADGFEDAAAQEVWVTAEPKRPPSAYFLFAASRSKALGSTSEHVEQTMITNWRGMTTVERKVWVAQAAELSSVYEKQREQYKVLGRYRLSPDIPPNVLAGVGGQGRTQQRADCSFVELAPLKRHIIKMNKETDFFDECLTEEIASVIFDRFSQGVYIDPHDEAGMANFVKSFVQAMQHERENAHKHENSYARRQR